MEIPPILDRAYGNVGTLNMHKQHGDVHSTDWVVPSANSNRNLSPDSPVTEVSNMPN